MEQLSKAAQQISNPPERQSPFEAARRARRPSLLKAAPLLVLTLIFLANRWQKTDPDLWGHIRFGQMMLSTGHIVSRDPYSYSAFGSSWRDHEYLTEIVMATIYNASGVVGLKVWKLLCITATILLLVKGLGETDANYLVQLNTLAVAVAVMIPYVQFRPQIHTYALFALMLALLAKDNYRGSAPLWILVPVMALWSNLHGGFVIGLAALVSYTGALVLLDLLDGRRLRRAGTLGLITIAAVAVTLLPPNGLNSWRAVVKTLSSPLTYRCLADWQPLWTAISAQWQSTHTGLASYFLLFALWFAFTVSIMLRPWGGDLPMISIALLMNAGALRAERNAPLAAMACLIPTARHLELLCRGGQFRGNIILPQWAQGIIACAVLLLTTNKVFSSQLPTEQDYPAAAVDYMKQHRLRGNILTYFCWGEYLIWHLAPDSKVFFDSRYDMVYPAHVINDYLSFYWGLSDANGVMAVYRHDFILIPSTQKISSLRGSAGWKLIYSDRESALFARADSPAARVGAPVAARAPELQYFP